MLAFNKCKLLSYLGPLAERSVHQASPRPRSISDLSSRQILLLKCQVAPKGFAESRLPSPCRSTVSRRASKKAGTQPVCTPSYSCPSVVLYLKLKTMYFWKPSGPAAVWAPFFPLVAPEEEHPTYYQHCCSGDGWPHGNGSAKHHGGLKSTTQKLKEGRRQPIQPDHVSTAVLTKLWSLQVLSCLTAMMHHWPTPLHGPL